MPMILLYIYWFIHTCIVELAIIPTLQGTTRTLYSLMPHVQTLHRTSWERRRAGLD